MNSGRAQELVEQFASKKILVVGDVVLDQYIRGTVERINPEAPVPILHAHDVSQQSGGAGNTAKNVAALGGHAALIGVVGTDTTAAEVRTAAAAEGYRAECIVDSSRPTTRKIRYIAASQQMLRVDYEETHPLDATTEDSVIQTIVKHAPGSDGIIISDYGKGVITEQVAETVTMLSAKHRLPLAVDAKPASGVWFTGASFISPNLKEARAFLGMDPYAHTQADWQQLATQLHQQMKTDVFLTLSADGIYVVTDSNPGQHVAQRHQVEVADTSGAGDTATVVLLLSLLAGASATEAAELANAAGAVVVSKLGAVGVKPEELMAMISQGKN